ncbi:helix-turn-helix transcriptional regulator [Actinacidiphila acidipaludis]|uniref:WYL domain-containing protein n=1 Tax=Actinacidiphila acidipaludis TaxID=2873382 RepID=A0ABS7Q8Z8_9ACTN|nr:WYL domain-containing protein [Streptomyces acidipaludis]MBY8878249.1 WYL domain-containing protein [Streptomyces acidipaludis]
MPRPTSRVLTLLELLQSGGTRTVAELADRLGVDGRTVRRYVDQLVDIDVPVESVRGRYGGYRLGPGYRLPPLMLSDDEALAVLLGLVAGRRAGLATAGLTASETASAKIRRVLPRPVARRLDALLETLAFTDRPDQPDRSDQAVAPDADVLLTLADAVRHRRPVAIRYTDGKGRRSERILHAYGIVSHTGRWYVTGKDAGIDEDRSFRLDRVADARALPGVFEVPEGQPDPARSLVTAMATAEYRYEVLLRIHGTAGQIRARLPASVATLEEAGPEAAGSAVAGPGRDDADEGGRWWHVRLRVERLDWLPGVLAALDRPFVIERPGELRELVAALADRLASRARQRGSGDSPEP